MMTSDPLTVSLAKDVTPSSFLPLWLVVALVGPRPYYLVRVFFLLSGE